MLQRNMFELAMSAPFPPPFSCSCLENFIILGETVAAYTVVGKWIFTYYKYLLLSVVQTFMKCLLRSEL